MKISKSRENLYGFAKDMLINNLCSEHKEILKMNPLMRDSIVDLMIAFYRFGISDSIDSLKEFKNEVNKICK